jgi:hypothetical protein
MHRIETEWCSISTGGVPAYFDDSRQGPIHEALQKTIAELNTAMGQIRRAITPYISMTLEADMFAVSPDQLMECVQLSSCIAGLIAQLCPLVYAPGTDKPSDHAFAPFLRSFGEIVFDLTLPRMIEMTLKIEQGPRVLEPIGYAMPLFDGTDRQKRVMLATKPEHFPQYRDIPVKSPDLQIRTILPEKSVKAFVYFPRGMYQLVAPPASSAFLPMSSKVLFAFQSFLDEVCARFGLNELLLALRRGSGAFKGLQGISDEAMRILLHGTVSCFNSIIAVYPLEVPLRFVWGLALRTLGTDEATAVEKLYSCTGTFGTTIIPESALQTGYDDSDSDDSGDDDDSDSGSDDDSDSNEDESKGGGRGGGGGGVGAAADGDGMGDSDDDEL